MARPGIKRSARLEDGRGAFDLMEEAIHLLRVSPLSILAFYLIGSLPFVLGLLYFWSDMSRSPLAAQQLVPGALGLSLLFVWMKVWQTVFAEALFRRLSKSSAAKWTIGRVLNLVVIQGTLQPFGLILLPIAGVLLIPFAWVYAFFQNVTVLGDGRETGLLVMMKRAWRQAKLWPVQNNTVIFCIQFFALFVAINCLSAFFMVPFLLKTLLGIETAISQSPMAMLNSTLLVAVLGLTYICVDPILKAIYVLRCFYGESLRTGQDLRSELCNFSSSVGRIAAMVIVCLTVWGGLSASSAEQNGASQVQPTASPSGMLPTKELDRTIDDIIHRPEYVWRMPRARELATQKPENAIQRFVADVRDAIGRAFKAVGRWIENAVRWIENKLKPNRRMGRTSGTGWIGGLQGLTFVLFAVVAAILAILIVRWWKHREGEIPEHIAAEAVTSVPNLQDENVGADQLPESGWSKLGYDLLAAGEWRLALRAFYLASLAHLAERNLVTIARYKSNLDYKRELQRRAHALPDLAQAFAQNVSIFDRTWYGLHAVDEALVRQFAEDVNRMKVA